MAATNEYAKLCIEDRDNICRLFCETFEISEACKGVVAQAIKHYSTKNYEADQIRKYVNAIQSVKDSLKSSSTFSHFKGFAAEWIACLEYNSIKNKENVCFTLVNPDPTSKADLLHVIKNRDGSYRCVAGPDVKTGSPYYMIAQFEKCIERGITMLDPTGILSEKNIPKLTKGQQEKVRSLQKRNGGRLPVQSSYRGGDISLIAWDLVQYISTGQLPSKRDRSGEIIRNHGKELFQDAAKKINATVKAEKNRKSISGIGQTPAKTKCWGDFHYRKKDTLTHLRSKETFNFVLKKVKAIKDPCVIGSRLFAERDYHLLGDLSPDEQKAQEIINNLLNQVKAGAISQKMTEGKICRLIKDTFEPNQNEPNGILDERSSYDPNIPDRFFETTKPAVKSCVEAACTVGIDAVSEDIYKGFETHGVMPTSNKDTGAERAKPCEHYVKGSTVRSHIRNGVFVREHSRRDHIRGGGN